MTSYILNDVVKLSIHPSKFLISKEEEDGRGGGRRMTVVTITTVVERPILSWS
jgi:hypothetical protein